jgi:hypothetical protein
MPKKPSFAAIAILGLAALAWLQVATPAKSATDTVGVSATVNQSVTCSTDAASTAFSTLTTAEVTTSTPNASTTMSCNVGIGCVLYVKDSNAGLATTSPAYTINSNTATLAAGSEGYGIQATTTTSGSGTIGLNALFGPTKWDTNQVGALTTSNVWIASSTAAVSGKEVVVKHKAAISGTTQAGTYSDTVTYECLSQ